jgi:hypothetical protein
MSKSRFSSRVLVGIFNSHNEHIRGEADPYAALFTDAKNSLSSTFGRELVITFWLGVTSYSHGFFHGFTGYFWRKCYQNCWRKSRWHSGETRGFNTSGLRPISHVRSENVSPPLTTIAGLDGVGLRLNPSNVTGPQTVGSSFGLHETLDVLIANWYWRGSYKPYLWSSSNQTGTWHFWTHAAPSDVSLSAVYWGRWAYVWMSAVY